MMNKIKYLALLFMGLNSLINSGDYDKDPIARRRMSKWLRKGTLGENMNCPITSCMTRGFLQNIFDKGQFIDGPYQITYARLAAGCLFKGYNSPK